MAVFSEFFFSKGRSRGVHPQGSFQKIFTAKISMSQIGNIYKMREPEWNLSGVTPKVGVGIGIGIERNGKVLDGRCTCTARA
jgi:hypothetical protein